MANCTTFPIRDTSNAVYYITNVILMPVIFGIGIIGNILLLVILNRDVLRKVTPVYVYLAGLAALDFTTFLLLVPKGVRDIEVLPLEITYGHGMSYLYTLTKATSYITKYAAIWMIMFTVAVRYNGVKHPFRKPKWTRNSTSRLIIFITFLFCVLVGFPRFLEVVISEVKGHCFKGMKLWDEEFTYFGRTPLYVAIYPWVVLVLNFLIPFSLAMVYTLILLKRLGTKKFFLKRVALQKPKNSFENEDQLSTVVIVLSVFFLLFELPSIISLTMVAMEGPTIGQSQTFSDLQQIANCVSLMRASSTFVIYFIFSGDFRKTIGRTFCCFCNHDDEFYETNVCCACCRKRDDSDVSEGPALDEDDDVRYEEKKMMQDEQTQKSEKFNGWI